MDVFGKELVDEYTMALIPEQNECGHLRTKIYKEDEVVTSLHSPYKLLDESLKYFGYTLEGAMAGSKSILNISKAVPIVLCSPLNMYWFPTQSPTCGQCIWISLCHLEEIIPLEKDKTRVIFRNGKSIIIPQSCKRIKAKIGLTLKLKKTLDERMKLVTHLFIWNDLRKNEFHKIKYFKFKQRKK